MRFDFRTRKATTNEDKRVLIISDSKYITPPKRMRRFWMWIIASRKCKETTIASLTLLSVVCMLVVVYLRLEERLREESVRGGPYDDNPRKLNWLIANSVDDIGTVVHYCPLSSNPSAG